MRVVYLARHGETEWNSLGKLQGANDIPLNARGREQAAALGLALAGEGIVRAMASDLSRARETSALAARLLGVEEPAVDPELRERAFGHFEGLTRLECEARFPEQWLAWRSKNESPPGAEPTALVVARMRRALLRCFDAGGPMLVVSHGASMRLLLNELTGEVHAPIANGAIYRLEDTGDTIRARIFDKLLSQSR
jgi:broad specificity phosphatase PhoE